LPERRLVRRRRPGRDELDRRVDEPHEARRLRGEAPVLVRGLVPDLPVAVHLVAEAPQAEAERVGRAVRAALVRQRGAARVVAVLEELGRLGGAARAEVDGHHDLEARTLGPARELVQAHLVRLDAVPRGVEPHGPLLARTYGVLPAEPGDEVPPGVAHDGRAEL